MTGISTNLIHGADYQCWDVTPPINITTTYKYPNDPAKLVKAVDRKHSEYFDGSFLTYSRLSHQNGELIQTLLGKLFQANVVVYNSGLSSFFALLTHYNPKRLFIGQAYHGCHGIADIWKRNHNLQILSLEDESNFQYLQQGDLVHLETPVNPYGTNYNIEYYAKIAHEKGAILSVDSTFAPPPLQDPFAFGADIVMHSATKYFGGHSDLLAGLLVTKDNEIYQKLLYDRLLLGTNIGNLESSLLVRSLKTYELRILRQSENAYKLVKFLHDNKSNFPTLDKIYHGFLQTDDYIAKQMPGFQSPVFSITLKSEQYAREFPSKLKYFIHATSLGGAESLIEWRAISDTHIDTCLLRVSVGVEDIDDLIEDFKNALTY